MNKLRRTFIKGLAYSSALSAAGLSSIAFANQATIEVSADSEAVEIVSLVNHTASSVNLKDSNTNQAITIAAGAEVSLTIASSSVNTHSHLNKKNLYIKDVLLGHIAISSDYAEYNGIFPTSFFGIQT